MTEAGGAGRKARPIAEDVLAALEPGLAAQGFTRHRQRFHRSRGLGVGDARVEGIALEFGADQRQVQLYVTVKFPALIELLHEVRPFTYQAARAWAVPDFASHTACCLWIPDLPRVPAALLPPYVRQREDGHLRRSRASPVASTVGVLMHLIEAGALPALDTRLTLERVAAAAERHAYRVCGIAGAWPLAARLLLGDVQGAGRAFARQPRALGRDQQRFQAGCAWLQRKGLDLAPLQWPPLTAHDPFDRKGEVSLHGDLV
jgi:hypothetical protein